MSLLFKLKGERLFYITLVPDAQVSLLSAVIHNKQGDTKDIWVDNIVDKYLARPNTECFLTMCLATFASEHIIAKSNQSDSSVALEDDMGYIQPRSRKRCIIRYRKAKMKNEPEHTIMVF